MSDDRPIFQVTRAYESPDSGTLRISKTNTPEHVGYITYKVYRETIADDTEQGYHEEIIGHIADTVMEPEYQGIGLLTDCIDRVICDMVCMGAENQITLNSKCDPAVWEKFGFKRVNLDSNHTPMILDISNRKCECITSTKVQGRI